MEEQCMSTFIEAPILAVWQVINLLDEARARFNSAELSDILAEAETVLITAVSALVQRSEGVQTLPASMH
jgi:hypothetical protein